MSDTPRTDVAEHNMGSVVEPHYVVDADFSRYLERELVAEKEWVRQSTNSNARLEKFLAEAQAEIVRLKGEAESWEKVFDRTCEHLADAKEQLRLCNVDQFTTAAELADAVAKERERCARVCEEFYSVENIAQKCAAAIRKGK